MKNTGKIQEKYRKNTGKIQEKYRKNTSKIQEKYRENTGKIQGKWLKFISENCFHCYLARLHLMQKRAGSTLQTLHWVAWLFSKWGKAGGHEPPLFPLPCHILAFFSSGSHEPPLFPLPYHHIWLFRAKHFFKWYILGL